MEKNKYNYTIDSVKLLLAATVVIMHGFLSRAEYKDSFEWHFIANYAFRVAVPFFFIVSGYLFYFTKLKSKRVIWFKHILKIYLIWLAIYSYGLLSPISSEEISFFSKAKTLFEYISFGPRHLWFIPALILSAIIVPYLSDRLKTKHHVLLILFIWFSGCSLNYYMSYHGIYRYEYYSNFFFFGIPIFSVGYLIAKCRAQLEWFVDKSVLCFSILASLTILESILSFYALGKIGSAHYISMDLFYTSIFLSTSIFFICLKHENFNILKGKQRYLSMFSYYGHIILLDALILILSNTDRVTITMIVIPVILILFYLFEPLVRKII